MLASACNQIMSLSHLRLAVSCDLVAAPANILRKYVGFCLQLNVIVHVVARASVEGVGSALAASSRCCVVVAARCVARASGLALAASSRCCVVVASRCVPDHHACRCFIGG